MDTLPDNWLDLAASHGATKWVQNFVRAFLPQLKDQSVSAETFAQSLDEELLARHLLTPTQQKNYRSNVVQAIKSIDPSHPAIALIAPTAEEYRELNDAQRATSQPNTEIHQVRQFFQREPGLSLTHSEILVENRIGKAANPLPENFVRFWAGFAARSCRATTNPQRRI